MLHKVSELIRAVIMSTRHMCASGVILYEVSVSVHAVDISTGHVCTAGECYMRHLSRYMQ